MTTCRECGHTDPVEALVPGQTLAILIGTAGSATHYICPACSDTIITQAGG